MNTQKSQFGFTLIELMFVVMIIGVLVSVALPAYRGYLAKSQFTVGLADISPGKTMMEVFINDEITVTTADSLGLALEGGSCSLIAANGDPNTGISGITCTLIGGVNIQGKIIRLNRDASGRWRCETDVDPDFYRGCESGTPVALSNS